MIQVFRDEFQRHWIRFDWKAAIINIVTINNYHQYKYIYILNNNKVTIMCEAPAGQWLQKRRVRAPPSTSLPDGSIRTDYESSVSAVLSHPPRHPVARSRRRLSQRRSCPIVTTPTRPVSTRLCSLYGRPGVAPMRRRDAAPRWLCGHKRLPPPDAPATSARIASDSKCKANSGQSHFTD